mgnify:CR=1 FL=1
MVQSRIIKMAHTKQKQQMAKKSKGKAPKTQIWPSARNEEKAMTPNLNSKLMWAEVSMQDYLTSHPANPTSTYGWAR